MMRVTVSHRGGMNFEARADQGGARVALSGPAELGDGVAATGPRPMEAVLMGLGGCSGVDVLAMLKKGRQVVDAFDIDIEAARADGVPAVFTRIHLRYRFRGDGLERRKVMRAVALSMQKYCSVTRMLEKTAVMSYAVAINGEDIPIAGGDGDGGGDGAGADAGDGDGDGVLSRHPRSLLSGGE